MNQIEMTELIAKALADRGVDVTVLTGSTQSEWGKWQVDVAPVSYPVSTLQLYEALAEVEVGLSDEYGLGVEFTVVHLAQQSA